MAHSNYEVVLHLAEQLNPQEQRALIEHLQAAVQQRELSVEEWQTVLNSLRIETPLIGEFSDRRSDWYDDDGR